MSSPVDDILNARLDVLENECKGENILLDNCQESFNRIKSERSDKFYNANMGLECRKKFNNKNCKSFISGDNGKGVVTFVDKYCGTKGNFFSRDCFTMCNGELKHLLTTCPNKYSIFVFILFILWILMFFYRRLFNSSNSSKEPLLETYKFI